MSSLDVIRPQPGPQEEFLKSSADIVIYGGSAGGGKALQEDHGVLTPNGYVAIKDIKVGDTVVTPSGKLSKVVGHHPQGIKQLYSVVFKDKTRVLCCGDHLWKVHNRATSQWSVLSTKILYTLLSGDQSSAFNSFSIPLPRSVSTKHSDCLIHSKLMAALIFCPQIKLNKIHRFVVLGENTPKDVRDLVEDYVPANHRLVKTQLKGKNCWVIARIREPNDLSCQSELYDMIRYFGLNSLVKERSFIPEFYLYNSTQSRSDFLITALNVGASPDLTIYRTNPRLAKDLRLLAHSLGAQCLVVPHGTALAGTEYEYKECQCHFDLPDDLFYKLRPELFEFKDSVDRLSRQNNSVDVFSRKSGSFTRKIERISIAESGKAFCITIDDPAGLFITDEYVVTHNSYSILLEPLYHVNNPEFGSVIFRRTYSEITTEGGLWDESEKIYPLMGATPRKSSLEWEFASGAKIRFAHMQHEATKLKYHGAQIPLIEFDELTTFSESMFFYMLSRNRSTSGIKPYIRASCNPDSQSWVANFISWWIDSQGFIVPERSGVVRYFIRHKNEIIWADSTQELLLRYPKAKPKSFTFIRSSIYDNKILMNKDPGYLANLESLEEADRRRLLDGNWKIRSDEGIVFEIGWFEIIDYLPPGFDEIRFWDLAATEEDFKKGTACYTAGVRMREIGVTQSGDKIVCVVDVIEKRVGPAQGDLLLKEVAFRDGYNVRIGWEQEGGSSGKRDAAHISGLLEGFNRQPYPPIGDKIKRAKPFAKAAQESRVKILRGDWNDNYLARLQSFPIGFKDVVDASSGAYNALGSGLTYTTAFRSTTRHYDLSSQYKTVNTNAIQVPY